MNLRIGVEEWPALRKRIQWLSIFRLATAGVFLIAVLIFQPGESEGFLEGPFWAFLGITSLHFFAGIIFGLLFSTIKKNHLIHFAVAQILWDLFFATLVVYLTGGIKSIFTPIYWLTIINASFLLFQTGAILAASMSGVLYGTLVNLLYWKHIPMLFNSSWNPTQWQESDVLTSVILHSLGFFAVATMANYVSSTYRTAEIRLSAKSLELENLEALTKSIVESLTNGVISIDDLGLITFWNEPAENMTELPKEEVLQKPLNQILPQLFSFLEKDQGKRLELEKPWRWEMEYISPKGKKKILGFSAAVLRDAKQVSHGTLIVFQDLTRFQEMEEKIKHQDRMAMLGELASRMAHEIRNPLTSVSGAIEMFQTKKNLTETENRLIGIALKEIDRLDQLLTDFLLYARPSVAEFENVLLDELIQETLDLFSKNSKNSSILLQAHLEPHLFVWGDSKRLRQLIWNLIQNAKESMEEEGKIQVSLFQEKTKGEVVVEVKDQGRGIPKQVKEQIFQPFFTTKTRGTGLGLAVVHRISQEHQATLWAENNYPQGAIFRVQFPKKIPSQKEGEV